LHDTLQEEGALVSVLYSFQQKFKEFGLYMSSSSSRVQWRRFAFFDKDVVNERIDSSFDSVPTSARAEGGMLVFGDANGNIFITDHNFQMQGAQKFKAFRGEVKAVSYLFDSGNQRQQFVVAVGDDSRPRIAADGTVVPSITKSYVIKVFNLADVSRPVNAFLASPGIDDTALLTSFSVMQDGSQIAVGFSNRAVLLFSGSFLKEGAMLRNMQPEVILSPRPALMPITGLHFCEISTKQKKTAVSNDNNIRSLDSKKNSNSSSNSDAGNGNKSRPEPVKRMTRLFVVIDIDTAVAAAADANSVPYLEGNDDENMRQQYPGTFGSSMGMERVPLSSNDVMNMAEGGVLLLDTSVVITENASGTTTTQAMHGRRAMHILDERGAGSNCSSLMLDTYELLLGRAEGVFSYSIDDRGGAAGFEGDKQCICTVGRYVLVGSTDLKSKRASITIYDLRNKFISMHAQLPHGERILHVLNDGGAAYIVTSSFTLLRFREKDTQSKLDVLLRKSLYPLAIALAAEEQCEVAEIMKLYRTYGDHLYKKGDFDGSVQQYCHTIGFLQPSYVVRRFLDPHRVLNLVHYLEKLQEKGLASNDHAVLTLTCYTKMEESQKILRYIYTCSNKPVVSQYTPSTNLNLNNKQQQQQQPGNKWVMGTGSDDSLTEEQQNEFASASGYIDFDADISVDILKNAGLIDEALILARRCNRYLRTMELLIDRAVDKSSVDAAMAYLTELVLSVNSEELISIINIHGPSLLVLQPDVITALFVRLMTGDLDSLRQGTFTKIDIQSGICIEDIIAVYVDNTPQLYLFLESVLENRRTMQGAPLPPRAAETLLELYLEEYAGLKKQVVTLEQDSKNNKTALSTARKAEKAMEKKVLSFMDGHLTDTYDPSQALLLVHSAGCEAASRFLLDRLQSTELLMRKHIKSGDEKGIFKVLRREGRKDPELYVQVLTHFVRQAMEEHDDEDEDERWDSVREVLRLIEAEDALSPMQIVSVCAQHPQLPLSLIGRYIEKSFKETVDDIETLEGNLASTAKTLENLQSGKYGRNRVASAGSARSSNNTPVNIGARNGTSTIVGSGNSKKGGKGSNSIIPSKEKKYRNSTISESDNDSHGNDSMGDPFSDEEEEDDDDGGGEMDGASLGSTSVSSRDRHLIELQENATEREKWNKIKALATKRANDHETFFAELEGSEDGFKTIATAFGKTMIQ
jgi:hypothetical protein